MCAFTKAFLPITCPMNLFVSLLACESKTACIALIVFVKHIEKQTHAVTSAYAFGVMKHLV